MKVVNTVDDLVEVCFGCVFRDPVSIAVIYNSLEQFPTNCALHDEDDVVLPSDHLV